MQLREQRDNTSEREAGEVQPLRGGEALVIAYQLPEARHRRSAARRCSPDPRTRTSPFYLRRIVRLSGTGMQGEQVAQAVYGGVYL